MLLDLCRARSMVIANTWFAKPDGRRVTYMAPGVGQLPDDKREWPVRDYARSISAWSRRGGGSDGTKPPRGSCHHRGRNQW